MGLEFSCDSEYIFGGAGIVAHAFDARLDAGDAYFGVYAFIAGEGVDVLSGEVETKILYIGVGGEFEVVSQRSIVNLEEASVLYIFR